MEQGRQINSTNNYLGEQNTHSSIPMMFNMQQLKTTNCSLCG